MKYLYFSDGMAKQSSEGPTDYEILCIGSGVLSVFRCYEDKYEELIVQPDGKNVWDTVIEAELCSDETVGDYHA